MDHSQPTLVIDKQQSKVQDQFTLLVDVDQIPQTDRRNQTIYNYIQPPRQLPGRHYSLEPDMKTGWKPTHKVVLNQKMSLQVFSIRYGDEAVNQIMKELTKNADKHRAAIVYLGNRRYTSFSLHQNRQYSNPYKTNNHIRLFQRKGSRPYVSDNFVPRQSFLKFNSDFQSGNLDMVVQRASNEFDLFIRVDTNTRGHSNWYNFEVSNGPFIGQVKFNIVNFRRSHTLYQQNLKPYVHSKLCKVNWIQKGQNLSYQRHNLRYSFLKPQEHRLDKYYRLSFTYTFQKDKDTTKFAYLPPYTYSQLLQFINTLHHVKCLNPFKSISGINIPILQIPKQDINAACKKKVVVITARIHPSQSNSSYVCQGFLQFLTSKDLIAKELRSRYTFYVIPMLNPDGVIAGNFRTSLSGKDLNRTFDKSRKYIFPETYQLLKFAKELKRIHQQQFCLYIDLHGHSLKKNVFMYGPEYSIQDSKYQISRELPKIMANLTSTFRFYSCKFHIPQSKLSTGRAAFHNQIEIPYTYTLETSNGSYYNPQRHQEFPFDIKSWKQIGIFLAKAIYEVRLQKTSKIHRFITQKYGKSDKKIQHRQQISDEKSMQSLEDSDADEIGQDLPQKMLQQLEQCMIGRSNQIKFPEKQKNLAKNIIKNSTVSIKNQSDGKMQSMKRNIIFSLEGRYKEHKGLSRNKQLNTSQILNKNTQIKSSFIYQRLEKADVNFPAVIETSKIQLIIKKPKVYDPFQRNKSMNIKRDLKKQDNQLIYYIGRSKKRALQYKSSLVSKPSVVIFEKRVVQEFGDTRFRSYLP